MVSLVVEESKSVTAIEANGTVFSLLARDSLLASQILHMKNIQVGGMYYVILIPVKSL